MPVTTGAIQFLAASPLFAGLGPPVVAQHNLISDPKDALYVLDFEPVARKNLPPAHFGYLATGIDDEMTLRANREGFVKFQLRPRRLVDVSIVDTTTEILNAICIS